MSSKEIALELAVFLDSSQARALPEPARSQARKIAEAFLQVAYGELGKRPQLFDGEDLRTALGQCLPGHFAARDPLSPQVPAVLEAFFECLIESQVVTQSFEIRNALDPALEAFAQAVRAGETPRRAGAKQKPMVHHAEKTGRNDPCVCGSGKKFKKCCGKQG